MLQNYKKSITYVLKWDNCIELNQTAGSHSFRLSWAAASKTIVHNLNQWRAANVVQSYNSLQHCYKWYTFAKRSSLAQ